MTRLAVITGTTHGIGRVTSRELARAGMTVVMLCRNMEAAREVRRDIQTAVPSAPVHVVHCDLASLTSVRTAASEVSRRFGPIALLVNNAGIVSTRRRFSTDGFELTFATNQLGPFLLTGLLRDRMAPGSRIVNVASRIHARGRLDLAGVTDVAAPYRSFRAYARSKLANVMWSFALARRLAGDGVTVNCLHPGVVASNLLPRWLQVVKPLVTPVTFDNERGARTTLHLALSDSVEGVTGLYFDEHGIAQPASATANDVALQERLWEQCARWTGGAPSTVTDPVASVATA